MHKCLSSDFSWFVMLSTSLSVVKRRNNPRLVEEGKFCDFSLNFKRLKDTLNQKIFYQQIWSFRDQISHSTQTPIKAFYSNFKIFSQKSLMNPQEPPLYPPKAQETINDKIYVIIVLVFTEKFFMPSSSPFCVPYLTLSGICGEAEISGIRERFAVFEALLSPVLQFQSQCYLI